MFTVTAKNRAEIEDRARLTVETLLGYIREAYGESRWSCRSDVDRRRELVADVMVAIVNCAGETEESAIYTNALARESLRVPL